MLSTLSTDGVALAERQAMPRHRLDYNAFQRPTQSWTDLGISLPYGASGELRTDCPQCSHGRQDRNGKSLAVNVEHGIFYCHYCGWKGNLKQPGSAPPLPRPGPRPRSPEEMQRRQMALERVGREARTVTPTDPVARYLERRGLWQEPLPEVVRYHPHLAYRHEDAHRTFHPALVATVHAPHGEVVTLHRIYLSNSGAKADVPIVKKSMPTPSTVTGAAVRLDTPTETLAVSEGIETALAVRLTAQIPV